MRSFYSKESFFIKKIKQTYLGFMEVNKFFKGNLKSKFHIMKRVSNKMLPLSARSKGMALKSGQSTTFTSATLKFFANPFCKTVDKIDD